MENPESNLDQRTMTYSDMVKALISIGNVRAAFINCIDSELLIVTRDGFKAKALDPIRERLPIWLQNSHFPKDPSTVYSFTCTKICRIRIVEIEGSPLRLKLMFPGIDQIL